MACKIGSEKDDTNDFTERARRKGEKIALLIIFLTRRRTSVARASLSLLQKMEMREESVGAAKNANAEDRRSDESS